MSYRATCHEATSEAGVDRRVVVQAKTKGKVYEPSPRSHTGRPDAEELVVRARMLDVAVQNLADQQADLMPRTATPVPDPTMRAGVSIHPSAIVCPNRGRPDAKKLVVGARVLDVAVQNLADQQRYGTYKNLMPNMAHIKKLMPRNMAHIKNLMPRSLSWVRACWT